MSLAFETLKGMINMAGAGAHRSDGGQIWSNDERGALAITVDDRSLEAGILTVAGSLATEMGKSDGFASKIVL